ncbi:hypothetical protein I5G24_24135, partial [Pseudomonas aeruginosa]|nr:hypothetical protein [Pseudomonas aeruginosa]
LNASRILLRGISQVFLQGDPRLGLACLLAIAVGAPPRLAGARRWGPPGPGGGGHLRRALVDLAEQVRGCIE